MKIIKQNNDNVKEITVKLISANPSFLMFPTALFTVGQQFKWKARFLVGMGYLYALCFNGNVARTTTAELKRILSTKSNSRIGELLEQTETLNRLTVIKADTKHPEKFVKSVRGKRGRKGKTKIELVLPQDLSWIEPNNRFFPFPKIAFLLPVSAQAKALYIYLHYLKDKETNKAVAGVRKIARALAITKSSIGKLARELKEVGALSYSSSQKGTEFFVHSPVYWPDRTLLGIAETYGLSHPFLKEWSIPLPENSSIDGDFENSQHRDTKFPNRGTPTRNFPIEGHLNSQYRDTDRRNFPIEGHLNSESSRDAKLHFPLTTSKEIITTSINNNIYNGDGNLQKLFKKSEKDRQRERKEESNKNNANSENNVQSKNGLRRKKIAPELAKIRSRLKAVGKELCSGRYRNFYDSLSEGLYSKRLREIYGPEWKTLAVMFEMLDRQWHSSERRFSHGYNRTSIRNVNGFLISMSEGRASFDDFFRTFCEVFGFRIGSSDLEAFKSFMRERMKEHEFKAWIEDGVSSVDADAGVVVLKDRIIRDFVEKHYLGLFKQFFGGQVRLEC